MLSMTTDKNLKVPTFKEYATAHGVFEKEAPITADELKAQLTREKNEALARAARVAELDKQS